MKNILLVILTLVFLKDTLHKSVIALTDNLGKSFILKNVKLILNSPIWEL